MTSLKQHQPPLLGFAAYSGTGKTTLLTQLIPLLKESGLRLAIIKHSHHDFEIDQPDKDSYKLRHAGCQQTLLTSKYRSALITENEVHKEPNLIDEINKLNLETIDLVLVEGFRDVEDLAKIELHRPKLGKPLLYPNSNDMIAIATDEHLIAPMPVLDLNTPEHIANFIYSYLKEYLK